MIVLLAIGLAVWVMLPWYGGARRSRAAGVVAAADHAQRPARTRRGQHRHASLPQRWGASSVIVIGIAGVVGVLVAMLAMGEGFKATLARPAATDTAIVMRGGSAGRNQFGDDARPGAVVSAACRASPRRARQADRCRRSCRRCVNLPSKGDGTDANVQFRGVGAEAWAVRPNIKHRRRAQVRCRACASWSSARARSAIPRAGVGQDDQARQPGVDGRRRVRIRRCAWSRNCGRRRDAGVDLSSARRSSR